LTKLTWVRWIECEAHVREETNAFGMLDRKPEKKGDGLEDQGVDGRIVVLCTFKKQEYGAGSILIL
jgi:hypothetical protein